MKCKDNKLNDKKFLKEEMENAINGSIKEEIKILKVNLN